MTKGLAWGAAACVVSMAACGDSEEDTTTTLPLTSGVGGSTMSTTTSGAGAGCPNTPSCGPGQMALDLDADGCGDTCCFVSCDVDMVLRDDDGDGCNERCGDAPCTSSDDCDEFSCFVFQDTCDAPAGVCSDNACIGVDGGCGCDGNTYATACAAAEAGVGLDTTGVACP